MKKLLSIMALLSIVALQAQFGIKGGLTYNADDGLFKALDNTYEAKGEGSVGYHLGIFKKIELGGLYVQPELWYVNFKNKYESSSGDFNIKYNRIDVPVSVGTGIMKVARVQGGLVFSYYMEDDIDWSDVGDIEQDDIALGFQIGAGVDLDKFTVDVRYDFPLGERQTEWTDDNGFNFQTNSSPKLLHVSLGYKF